MKFLLRVLGVTVACFFILVFATSAVLFVRKVWFGSHSSKAYVKVIDVEGIIMNSSSTIREIEETLDDKSAKAIVVRINSPGGLVAPSQELFEAFKRADQKIPVIMSMVTLAASGGYYLALAGRKIYANPGTLTASIGVIMEFMNTEKLYSWAKVERFSITAGRMKDAGSPLKPMTAEERDLFQKMLADIHSQFRGTVKERRKLSDAQLDGVADGRVMTGNQAFQAKLVDALGGTEDAIREAKQIAKLPDTADVEYPDRDTGLLRKLILGESESSFKRLVGILEKGADAVSSTVPSPGWKVMLLAPVR